MRRALPVSIGLRALDVLSVLVKRPGKLVTKEEIIAAVWGRTVVESANLTVQISTLRGILDEGCREGSCIQTVAARGYRFLPTVTRVESAKPASMERPAGSISQPEVAPRLSIVVLPFADLSEGGGHQYFADGITDDLTTDLSRISGSFVIARGTAFTYKGKAA
jgi:DNA-binding winged helix-turn-helix (wHTH) protein